MSTCPFLAGIWTEYGRKLIVEAGVDVVGVVAIGEPAREADHPEGARGHRAQGSVWPREIENEELGAKVGSRYRSAIHEEGVGSPTEVAFKGSPLAGANLSGVL